MTKYHTCSFGFRSEDCGGHGIWKSHKSLVSNSTTWAFAFSCIRTQDQHFAHTVEQQAPVSNHYNGFRQNASGKTRSRCHHTRTLLKGNALWMVFCFVRYQDLDYTANMQYWWIVVKHLILKFENHNNKCSKRHSSKFSVKQKLSCVHVTTKCLICDHHDIHALGG